MTLLFLIILLGAVAFIAYNQFLLRHSLSTMNAVETDKQHLSPILAQIRQVVRADSVMVLKRVDEHSAQILCSSPPDALPAQILSATIFETALDTRQPVYRRGDDVQSAVLKAMRIHNVAVLPVDEDHALLCTWEKPRWFRVLMRQYLQTVAAAMRMMVKNMEMQQHLKVTTSRLNIILDTIPQAVIYIDDTASNAWTNPPAARLLGIQAGETTPDRIAAAMFELRQQSLNASNNPAQDTTFYNHQALHDWLWHYPDRILSVSHIPSDTGRLWLFEDVTERKQLESDHLQYTLQRARARLLSQFIQSAAHEYRTPLSIIRSSAYLIARIDDPVKRRAKAEQIEQQVVRISHLTDMSLKMSGLEAGIEQPTTVCIADTLQQATTMMIDGTNSGLNVSVNLSDDLPLVRGSSSLLYDAICQVLDNAKRYTPAGGTITINALTDDNHVIIDIIDNGTGIAAEDLPYIFDMFWRQDRAHATPGLGLGLPFARKIFELHNGSIDAYSTAEQGAHFRIKLPAARQHIAHIRSYQTPVASSPAQTT